MSTDTHTHDDTDTDVHDVVPEPTHDPVAVRDQGQVTEPVEVVVRRNGLLSLVLAAVCALVAAAFLSRGFTTGAWIDWAVGIVLVAMTWGYVFTLLDSRTPLMVADDHGIRLRLGRNWRGMAWHQLEEVEHQPRRWLRDGRLVMFPIDVDAELELLGRAGRRHATANEWLYHAAFTMPLALTTRVMGAHGDLTGALAVLAGGRCPIVQIGSVSAPVEVTEGWDVEDEDDVEDVDQPIDQPADEQVDEQADEPFDQERDEPVDEPVDEEVDEEVDEDAAEPVTPIPSPTPWPAREPRLAVRADVVRHPAPLDPDVHDVHDTDNSDDAEGDVDDPDATQPFDVGAVASMDDTGVWRASTVVIDDVADLPVVEPVIGPVLATARRVLHLDVDQLSERTKIRPHVIEAIEIDDFAVCGGDFFAQGHLRTLARVLGVEVAPLLAIYQERYADAPIDPKRVFEADLAGARRGPIRSTRGGPNWSVLVAAVMTLVLAWSVARLVTDHPAHTPGSPGLADQSAGLTSSDTKAAPVPVTLTAAGGGAHLVVRDGTGKVVFTGDLAFGQSRTLSVAPPVRVQSTDGSTRISVQGKDEGKLGKTGQPAEHVYTAR